LEFHPKFPGCRPLPMAPRCQSVDMTQGGNIYRDAERRLLDAIRAGEVCEFADWDFADWEVGDSEDEMASWGPERTIRATLLRRLLTAENAQYAADGVRLRGAAVEGVLDLQGRNVLPLDLGDCRIATLKAKRATFTGKADFDGATFTGDASFDDATFTRAAHFNGATFIGTAEFGDAIFIGDASFGDAEPHFIPGMLTRGATFTRDASFKRATFIGTAEFGEATFTGDAWFDRTTFTGNARFASATFTGTARFDNATFTDDAWFDRTTFTGNAWFDSATFIGTAEFDNATFTNAGFTFATFTGDARFRGAIADAYDLGGAQFHATDPGPWVARQVTLAGAVFHVRARVGVAAVEKVDCGRLQAREGVHLLVRGGGVDLEDAEFLRRSILAHSASEPTLPNRLAQVLVDELDPQYLKRTRVVSLRRATAGELVLSGVGLEDCVFAGAHGLDKLRIDATCSFQRPPAWPRETWRPFTNRRLIAEEAQWRQVHHTRGWVPASTTASPESDDSVPTALEIAGIYRDLRKGLEDAKDEPGAADFYYGEMEMRRLAARKHRHQDTDRGEPKGRRPSWTERRLLDAYWAVSGYGLRAWRALTALAVLLIGCAALFTLPAFVKTQPGASVPFTKSLEFTARESLTLTRAAGPPTPTNHRRLDRARYRAAPTGPIATGSGVAGSPRTHQAVSGT
jgi:uncharacterized protein YjbI with pentapeptide repeats